MYAKQSKKNKNQVNTIAKYLVIDIMEDRKCDSTI